MYPDPAVQPVVTSINFSAGQTRGNNAVVALNDDGTVTAYCSAGVASVQFILDVSG